MIKNIFYKVTGDPNDKEIKRLQPIVQEINTLEPDYEKLSDEELALKTDEFRVEFGEAVTEAQRELEELRADWANALDEDERRQVELQIKEREKALLKLEQETLDNLLPDAFAAVR